MTKFWQSNILENLREYITKMTSIPKSHPRYISLKTREKIAFGVKMGVTSMHGLLAHGRGEAFDYLIEEKTNKFAVKSINAASAMLLLAKKPVISVNGNSAVLAPKYLVELSEILDAPLEVNVFHASKKRERNIKNFLIKYGSDNVLLPQKNVRIKYIDSNRKYVNKDGIYKADVVFVPLEDGDRTEALIKNGKKVITIDLNPMSRTSQNATVTVIDNIVRAMPQLIKTINMLKKTKSEKQLHIILKNHENKKNLAEAMLHISQRLSS